MSTKSGTHAVGRGILSRVLDEGYGPGAWHGADLKAAIADISADAACRRPGPDRHNIAEITLHHAFYVHDVRARLTGTPAAPFVHEDGEWASVPDSSRFSWNQITETLDTEQRQLAALVTALEEDAQSSPLSETERFDLVLGITSHAIYHAGQVQLIKKLI